MGHQRGGHGNLGMVLRHPFVHSPEGVGTAPEATTPWLMFTPNDNQFRLDVQQGAWQVDAYIIEKELPNGTFAVLDTVDVPTYVDEGLVNGTTYCYRVTTLGRYDDPTTEVPLVNRQSGSMQRPSTSRPRAHACWTSTPYCDVERTRCVGLDRLGATSTTSLVTAFTGRHSRAIPFSCGVR